MSALRTTRSSIRRHRAESRLFNYFWFTFVPIGAFWIIVWLGSAWNGGDAVGGFVVSSLIGALVERVDSYFSLKPAWSNRFEIVAGLLVLVAALTVAVYWFDFTTSGAIALATWAAVILFAGSWLSPTSVRSEENRL